MQNLPISGPVRAYLFAPDKTTWQDFLHENLAGFFMFDLLDLILFIPTET